MHSPQTPCLPRVPGGSGCRDAVPPLWLLEGSRQEAPRTVRCWYLLWETHFHTALSSTRPCTCRPNMLPNGECPYLRASQISVPVSSQLTCLVCGVWCVWCMLVWCVGCLVYAGVVCGVFGVCWCGVWGVWCMLVWCMGCLVYDGVVYGVFSVCWCGVWGV